MNQLLQTIGQLIVILAGFSVIVFLLFVLESLVHSKVNEIKGRIAMNKAIKKALKELEKDLDKAINSTDDSDEI